MDALPPADTEARKELLATLTAEPPSEDLWQVGGGCNFMITAARLGLQVGCCGNVGQDRFGDFLKSTLQVGAAVMSALLACSSHLLHKAKAADDMQCLGRPVCRCLLVKRFHCQRGQSRSV